MFLLDEIMTWRSGRVQCDKSDGPRSLHLASSRWIMARAFCLFAGGTPETTMPYQDFRQFLDVLRQQGELIDINRPIALDEVGKALKQAYQQGRPAISFNDNGTDFPLVCGVYSSRAQALLAFQTDEKSILQKV